MQSVAAVAAPRAMTFRFRWLSLRRFDLVRDVDISGVSGVGLVASGVVLPLRLGALMRWNGPYRTVTWYRRVGWVEKIHGHGGASRMVYR